VKTLRGIGVSPGYASGRIVIYRSLALDTVQSRPIEPGNIETEFERFIEAAEHAQEELSVVREQVAADVGESEAAIFDAHIAMLSDSSLKQNMHERLRTSRICAEAAVAAEVRAFASRLASSNCAYMHELATDIHDVGNRLLRHLYLDEGQNRLAELPPNSVIMARDLMPSETICMDREHVSGIATECGGPTAHTAILARSLGIPAISGLGGLLNLANSGKTCLLDGAKGMIILDPSDAQRHRQASRRREYEQSRELMCATENQVCRLKNNTRIKLMANIHQSSDVDLATEHNLDGIGLFRTELMYLSARSAPTCLAQSRQYNRVAEACGTDPVTIRTFDFSVDKHPPFLSLDASKALEMRGLRFALHQRHLFKTQLRAIVHSACEHPNIRILFPMVTGWWELQEALDLVHALCAELKPGYKLPVGAMIETPAAIFALPEILKLVEFIAIGCNDLAHYMLVHKRSSADRTVSEAAMHPSLLRAIRLIAETASQADCPVCVCGEAASDPIMAAIFIGLGIRRLSVSPARAPTVHYALRHLRLAEAKKIAACATQTDPFTVHRKLQTMLPEELRKVLTLEPESRCLNP